MSDTTDNAAGRAAVDADGADLEAPAFSDATFSDAATDDVAAFGAESESDESNLFATEEDSDEDDSEVAGSDDYLSPEDALENEILAASEEDEEMDPLEEFRLSLKLKPGDWYVIHSYAGYENKVKTNLEHRARTMNMEDFIYEAVVPIESVKEVKNGVLKEVKRNKFPGYVLVRMDLTDESWGTVRHTPGVTGFVGHGNNPAPLTFAEVERILAPAPEAKSGDEPSATGKGKGAQAAAQVPVEIDFAKGDSVTVIAGPFATMHANISDINTVSHRVTVLVELFGRETPVELGFNEIQKN